MDPGPQFGIVTALPKEFAAVRVMLDCCQAVFPEGDPNQYVIGDMPALNGVHRVVLTLLPKTGNNPASGSCSDLLRSFPSIQDVLMVGIAGGIPRPDDADKHVRLGDLVISETGGIVQYDNLKLSSDNVEVRDNSAQPSAFLGRYVRSLEAGRIAGGYPWEAHFDRAAHLENASRPDESTDRLFAPSDQSRELPHPFDPYRAKRSGMPKIHYGRIGSANILMKDPVKRDAVARQHGVRAIEMEGSGIADAAWSYGRNYLIIRGICDYCDTHKNDLWQGYAAVVAAAYAREALLAIIPAATEGPANVPSPGKPEPEHAASLDRLRRLSSTGIADARIVDWRPREGSSGVIALDQGLYVTRKAEREILERLDEPAEPGAPRIFVVGDAGFGKTSLLWSLHRQLHRERWEAWFLKSSLFSQRSHLSRAGSRLSIDDLVQASALVIEQGRRPVLLLDTVQPASPSNGRPGLPSGDT